MKKLSIKLRVTLWYTLILSIISIGMLFAIMKVSEGLIIFDSRQRIEKSVDDFSRMVTGPKRNFQPVPEFKYFDRGTHIAVLDENGEIIDGFLPYEFADEIVFKDGEVLERTYNDEKFLTYSKKTTTHDGDDVLVAAVVSVTDKMRMLDNINKANIIFVGIIIIFAAAGGYLIIWEALRPVDKITKTAKIISNGSNLSQRIKLRKGNDEIYHLADTFDEMLDKIESTFEKEKQFTQDASHELRTPVAVINSECEYVLDCANSLDDAKESVLSIKQQSDKMSKLISELLTISRMDREALKINFENVDLSELLNFVCDEQEEIRDNNISLHRNITEEIFVKADRMLIARVFVNLISNAYAYGKENGNIWVGLYKDGERVVLEVRDDGIGISKENLPKIWERFYQVDSSRTNEDNMGLGLSMVKWIVARHNGEISAQSELGKGTTIRVLI